MMGLEIIDKPFHVTLHGYSGKVLNKNYAGTGSPLMDAKYFTLALESHYRAMWNAWCDAREGAPAKS